MYSASGQTIVFFLIVNFTISYCALNSIPSQNSLNGNGTSENFNIDNSPAFRDPPVVSMDTLIEPNDLAKLTAGTIITGVTKSLNGDQPIRNSLYNPDVDYKNPGNSSVTNLDLVDEILEGDWNVGAENDNDSSIAPFKVKIPETEKSNDNPSWPIYYMSPNLGVLMVFFAFTILFFILAVVAHAADRRIVRTRNLHI